MKTVKKLPKRLPLEPFTKPQLVCALLLIGIFFSTMLAWGSLAPMGSAVVAPGVVSVETHRKAVQHLEGGIVGQILVKDGMQVGQGNVLVELRDIAATSNVERLETQYYEALASVARLSAERDNLADITFPDVLAKAATESQVASAAMAAQRKIFQSRRDLQTQKLSVMNKKIDRLKEESDGVQKQLDALKTQTALYDQEQKDANTLYDKQLIRKSRVLELQRNQSQLEGRRGALQASLAQNGQHMIELDLKKTELIASTLASVVDELRSRQARAHELSRELIAARDILSRTRIRAPIDGTVVGLQIFSKDGVIAPGQTLMEIVPLSDNLIVEARVRPEDIEEIRAGLRAYVVLNTLTRRYNHPIRGKLETVAADRVIDKLTGRPYYLVRVTLDQTSIEPDDTKLLAGMSADVFIQTGERTVLAYIAAPILRTMNRGMREN